MTTGVGRTSMIFARQVSPSISGMLTSSVTTSGESRSSWSRASTPLRAVCTSKSPARVRISFRARRISAESSTTSTLFAGMSAPSDAREGRLVGEHLVDGRELVHGEQLVDLHEQQHPLDL